MPDKIPMISDFFSFFFYLDYDFRLGNLVKSEDCRGESLCGELQRQCHCAAYNALIADICCTQTDIKFYNGFLFAENLVKVNAMHRFFLLKVQQVLKCVKSTPLM